MNLTVSVDDEAVQDADDSSARAKAANAVVSPQVMQEYFAGATRFLGVAAELAQRKVELRARHGRTLPWWRGRLLTRAAQYRFPSRDGLGVISLQVPMSRMRVVRFQE